MKTINLIGLLSICVVLIYACSSEAVSPVSPTDIPVTVQATIEKVAVVEPTVQSNTQETVDKVIDTKPEPTMTISPTPVEEPTPIPTPIPTPSPIAFLQSVLDDDLEKVSQFISNGVDVNSLVPESQPTIGGAGALHLAIMKGSEDMIQLLLDNGADIDIRDANMQTPLHIAVIMSSTSIVNLLINEGANVNATAGNSGATALDLANINGPTDIIDRLESIGAVATFQTHAQPDVKDFPTTTPIPTATPDMMSMMSQMMGGMGSGMDMSSMMAKMMGGQGDEEPSLQNLMFQTLGPWDSSSKTFGDLKYDNRLGVTVFDDFGYIHNRGMSNEYDNPTFEFKAPADVLLIAPISGVVTMLDWQPSGAYTQDDWDLIIAPSQNSKWGVEIDHIVSIDCDRSGKNPVFCDTPLKIDGETIVVGSQIEAGQVLGYIGNWSSHNNSGINGRTELTVFKYYDDYSGVTNYCPTMYLDESVEQGLKSAIQDLMVSYESWDGDSSIYNEEDMVAPGCRYSAILEVNGVTTPVTD